MVRDLYLTTPPVLGLPAGKNSFGPRRRHHSYARPLPSSTPALNSYTHCSPSPYPSKTGNA